MNDKKDSTCRGLQPDDNNVSEANSKCVEKKNVILDRTLCLIAQFAPSLLKNDIIKKSTSLG